MYYIIIALFFIGLFISVLIWWKRTSLTRNINRLNHQNKATRIKALKFLEMKGESKSFISIFNLLWDDEIDVINAAKKVLCNLNFPQNIIDVIVSFPANYKTVAYKFIILSLTQRIDILKEELSKTPENVEDKSIIVGNKETEPIYKTTKNPKYEKIKLEIKKLEYFKSESEKKYYENKNHKQYEEIFDNLQNNIPNGKYFNKEDKVIEFLPKVFKLREMGYDFIVEYRAEKVHWIEHPSKREWTDNRIVRLSPIYHHKTPGVKSGYVAIDEEGKEHSYAKYNVGDRVGGRWKITPSRKERIIDVKESINIFKGKPII